MKKNALIIVIVLAFYSCMQKNSTVKKQMIKIDNNWVDSVIKNSDTSFTLPYKRTDFVTATSYIKKSDSSICQIMKESANVIRQIIIAKKEVRVYFAQYYKNGQLKASLPLDSFGQYNGKAVYYYMDGSVESTGNYNHGLKQGVWFSYDEKGKPLSNNMFR